MDSPDDNQPESELQCPSSPPREEIIVRADEVDEAGADISTISSSDDIDLQHRVEARRQQDLQGSGSPRPLANAVSNGARPQIVRPILRREASAPPPPPRQPPPPTPPAQQNDNGGPSDSLSLAQLRDIVSNLPKIEPTAYAYTYEDTRSFAEELEEWFQYTAEDEELWVQARISFEEELEGADLDPKAPSSNRTWLKLSKEDREVFLRQLLHDMKNPDPIRSNKSLHSLVYLALGVWRETETAEDDANAEPEQDYEPPNEKFKRSNLQLRFIFESGDLLCRFGAVPLLFDLVRELSDNDEPGATYSDDFNSSAKGDSATMEAVRESRLGAALTILYFVVECGRQQVKNDGENSIRQAFVELEPSLLQYLSGLIAKLRWDDSSTVSFTRMLLLLWKGLLLIFGGSKELEESKKALRNGTEPDKDGAETILTASPLDYHVFRQEITSKYPAYNPPPPLVPLEINNNSILPPLPNHPSRSASQDSLHSLGPSNGIGKSIFHQPVHISTPAPSPPPSPAGPGGKGGKKQNYQTNQNFPFLYPPLDSASNDLGGKGSAEMRDKLVGKRWEGSDIPASILEAAQLFASRMRMSRSLRQLWEVREEFVKFERGWEGEKNAKKRSEEKDLENGMRNLDLDDEEAESRTMDTSTQDSRESEEEGGRRRRETDDDMVQGRLDLVEAYYRSTLPHLQSIVIVLLKVMLSNITVLGSQHHDQANGGNKNLESKDPDYSLPQRNLNLSKHLIAMTNGDRSSGGNISDRSLTDLNSIRTREITSKAISGFLLMLLKWFKISHVLKFEYMTQLLLDSNYLPLALKYFALQDIDKAVDLKNDHPELGFFRFCYLDAGNQPSPPLPQGSPEHGASPSSSEDEAQPPAISRSRQPTAQSSATSPPPSPGTSPSPPRHPEVDELGYPTTAQPSAPLTTYSPRFFFTHIATLRVLQKLAKAHAHRALLLVQYKSSSILRKNLRVPQPQLRLYTLKLFKAQVPFCGRKWRQANMRVITAIYVTCRMGLRDEWISGGGAVEEWVEGAVGVERAWRGLVGWWHGRGYRDAVVGEGKAEVEAAEEDFFARELEKMGWGVGGLADEGGAVGDDGGKEVGAEWEGGPLQLEGW